MEICYNKLKGIKMTSKVKSYSELYKFAEYYKKGYLTKRQLINSIGSFVLLDIENTITPQLSSLSKTIERAYINGK